MSLIAQRILDREARFLLREQLEAAGSLTGVDEHGLDHGSDERPTPLKGERVPIVNRDNERGPKAASAQSAVRTERIVTTASPRTRL